MRGKERKAGVEWKRGNQGIGGRERKAGIGWKREKRQGFDGRKDGREERVGRGCDGSRAWAA